MIAAFAEVSTLIFRHFKKEVHSSIEPVAGYVILAGVANDVTEYV